MQQKAAMLCQQFPSEYLPTDTLYEPAKWCSKCNIKIVSEAVLMAHMIKRHQKSCPDEVSSDYCEKLGMLFSNSFYMTKIWPGHFDQL